MKVILLSTFEKSGGAAIASYRLFEVLQRKKGVSVTLLSGQNHYSLQSRSDLLPGFVRFLFKRLLLLIDRSIVLTLLKERRHLFKFSLLKVGIPHFLIAPYIQEADIIHLHWTNMAFLSKKSMKHIIRSKPVIITLHDMWYITGGCQYSLNCENHKNQCGHCPMLRHPYENDVSRRQRILKEELFRDNVNAVGVSRWLTNLAKYSGVFDSNNCFTIHNGINIENWSQPPTVDLRQVHNVEVSDLVMTFGADKAISDERKGYPLLLDALRQWYPSRSVSIFVFGAYDTSLPKPSENIRIINLGWLNSTQDMINLYSATDVLIIPSLQEAFGQVAIEAMFCRTVCIGIRGTGLEDIISHMENGYLADFPTSKNILKALNWILDNTSFLPEMANKSHKLVVERFNIEKIADQYVDLYKRVLN